MRSASQNMLAWLPWAISFPRRMPRSRRITITCFGTAASLDSMLIPVLSSSVLRWSDTPSDHGDRASEPVACLDPVVPVLDRLTGLLVAVDDLQLRQRHRQHAPVLPGRLH